MEALTNPLETTISKLKNGTCSTAEYLVLLEATSKLQLIEQKISVNKSTWDTLALACFLQQMLKDSENEN